MNRKSIVCGVTILVLHLPIQAFFEKEIPSDNALPMIWRTLWGDDVESKIDVISTNATNNLSTEGTTNTDIKELFPTAITASFISSNTITLSTSGNYIVTQDLTADIVISSSNIALDLNHRRLTGIMAINGSGTTIHDIMVSNGFITPAAPSAAPSAGIAITSDGLRIIIKDVTVVCSDTTTNGIAGRSCIQIAGEEVSLLGCYLVSGAAAAASSGNAGAGGDGVELTSTSTYALIQDCFIITGNGGNSTDGSSNGGRGGHGIYVNGAAKSQIRNSIVNLTGNGGSDAGTGTGGNGGNAINITSNSTEIEIINCILRNTGTGTTGGTNGMAINDLVSGASSSKSMIWSNIATTIANTTTRFDIGSAGSEKGVSLSYTPTSTAVNVYANVYIA